MPCKITAPGSDQWRGGVRGRNSRWVAEQLRLPGCRRGDRYSDGVPP